ncbi:MAG: M20/M25/M40 family metallo-hydrolase [Caldisericia bacterium]|nr:M20/M25/M40 family metallo-hydrolase [Caldisericia bacterium]
MMKINKERLQSTFEKLLTANGISGNEDETINVVLDLIKDIPLFVKENASIDETKRNLFLKLENRGGSKTPSILLSAHLDTVESTEKIKYQLKNGKYTTDGNTILGSDDKAGVAAIIECLMSIHESNKPHPEIQVAFTVEEEVGLVGAYNYDFSLITSKRGIVIDSDGKPGTIMYAGPSQYLFDVDITGVSAHAGMTPENGKSAILYASQCISKIPFGRIDHETTTNVGTIKGGKANNIVADKCHVDGEIRSHNHVKINLINDQIKSIFLDGNKTGFKVEYKSIEKYSAFELNTKTEFMMLLTSQAKKLNLDVHFKVCGGGCDANIFNNRIKNMECVNFACGMTDVHTHKESIYLSDIEKITELITSICTK